MPLGSISDMLFRVVMSLWFIAFLGKTAWEIRRFYLLYHYYRGDATREDLPPLKEELPDGSLIDLLRHR